VDLYLYSPSQLAVVIFEHMATLGFTPNNQPRSISHTRFMEDAADHKRKQQANLQRSMGKCGRRRDTEKYKRLLETGSNRDPGVGNSKSPHFPFPVPVSEQEKGNDHRQRLSRTVATAVDT